MTIVDSLITEYKGRDESATSTADRVARANEHLSRVIQGVTGAFAALQIVDRAMEFGGAATKAASEYASLEARLKALVGTAEDAKRKLNMATLVAAPSPFTTKQLADAAVTLEAFRVNSERALPIIGKLGAAMGASDASMEMFTRAIGQLAQGHMIEADVMASMGVTRTDFEQQGIKFDGQGQLLSSAKDTLDALEKIINSRFGNIFDEMADTPEAKRASLEDSGEKLMRTIGTGMLKASAPWMDSLAKVIGAIDTSGVLGEVVEKITKAVTGVFGGDSSQGIAKFVAKVLSFFDMLPEKVKRVAQVIKTIGQTLETFFVGLVNLVGQTVVTLRNGMGEVLNTITKQSAPFFNFMFGTSFKPTEIKDIEWKPVESAGDVLGRITDAALFRSPKEKALEESYYQRMLEAMSKPQAGIPDTSNMPWMKNMPGKVEKAVEKAEAVTSSAGMGAIPRMDKIDVREILFGGGDRAKAGFSIADVTQGRRSRTEPMGSIKVEVKSPRTNDRFKDAVAEMINEVVAQALPELLRYTGATN